MPGAQTPSDRGGSSYREAAIPPARPHEMTMRLNLEIDLDKLAGDPTREVGRILRYWGGSMTAELLEPGVALDLYDSTYAHAVGTLTVEDATGPAA